MGGVKIGTEEGTKGPLLRVGPLLRAKFHPIGAPKVLEVQESARGPLPPCQVWWGSDFTRRRGGQKR